MKGKMLKRVVAAAATLAMIAQFGIVLPASAESETLYSQDYDSATAADWTTGTNGRYTPELKTEGSNKWLGVKMGERNNNGTTLTSPNYSSYISGKSEYAIEFDLALGANDNNQQGIAFQVNTDDGYLLRLAMPAPNSDKTGPWLINGSADNTLTFATSGFVMGDTNSTSTWYHYIIIYKDGDTHLKVTTKDGATTIFEPTIITSNTKTGKLTNMTFATSRHQSNFEIDNVLIRTYDADNDELGERGEETLESVKFTSQLNTVITQPAQDAPVHKPIAIEAKGIYGGDLTDEVTVEWSTTGLASEDGYISLTKAEGTGSGTIGDPADGPTAYFNVRNGVSTYFGSVTAKITYLDNTMTISTPFAVIGAAGRTDIAPKSGYPEEMNDYADDLVGYKATANGINDQDLVLNNWSIYGSNGARTLTLEKDEDGTKFLRFHNNGGGGSTVGVYQLADMASQYIVDMKVRFTGGDMSFGHYKVTPNNSGNDPNWSASYGSNALTLGGQSITGLNQTDWFRIVASADESAGTVWVKVYNEAGELVGEVADEPLSSTASENQKYFCFQGTWPVDLASFRIYSPSVGQMTVNGAETVSVPEAPKPEEITGKGLENSEVYTYDSESKKLEVALANTDTAKLLVAEYDAKVLKSLSVKDLTFAEGKAEVTDFTMPDSCKLMLWNSLDGETGMKPLSAAEGTGIDNPNLVVESETVELSAIVNSADGFKVTGPVTWSIDTDDESVSLKSTGIQTALLTVKGGASAGVITVTARCGEGSAEKDINLTTSGNSIAFTKSTASFTIPFSGGEAVTGEYAAKTVDKEGNEVEFAADADGNPTTTPSTITYSVLDKNMSDVTNNMPAGVTFNAQTGVLTVTDQAKAGIIYIQAKNNDATPLSRTVKVNIHGLAFSFGTNAPADDSYTQVTSADAYSDKIGYGFTDTSVLVNEATDVKGSADFSFKAKVPNGNYRVKLTGSGYITSESVDSINYTTGITRLDGKTGMTKQTDLTFNVAVCDEVLDLNFKDKYVTKENDVEVTYNPVPLVEKIEISQMDAKTALAKPAVYAIGDSTTKNGNVNKSWGEVADISKFENLGSFANHGQAGRNGISFYNQGRVEAVLLAICPGDYVTVNMGINTESGAPESAYYTLQSQYYVQAIIDRGAIPVLVTATPQGPLGAGAGNYNNGVFTCNRGTGARNGIWRKIAQEKNLNIIELGYWGDEYFNSLTEDDATAAGKSSVLELVKSWYGDHNHYTVPFANEVADYILGAVNDIAGGSDAYNQANDPHINEQ